VRKPVQRHPPEWHSNVAVERLPHGRPRIIRQTLTPCSSIWPSIAGSVVAWTQEGTCPGHLGSDVILYNLKTSKTVEITHNHGSSEAVTNGKYVAWEQGPAGSGRFDYGAIMLRNLKSGKVNPISRRPVDKSDPHCAKGRNSIETCADWPVISDDVAAWMDAGQLDIVARDLRTGTE